MVHWRVGNEVWAKPGPAEPEVAGVIHDVGTHTGCVIVAVTATGSQLGAELGWLVFQREELTAGGVPQVWYREL